MQTIFKLFAQNTHVAFVHIIPIVDIISGINVFSLMPNHQFPVDWIVKKKNEKHFHKLATTRRNEAQLYTWDGLIERIRSMC
jgi:phenylalanine-4-hydroxylase